MVNAGDEILKYPASDFFSIIFPSANRVVLKKCKEILTQGSIIIFPSHVWHRVKPVTKGVRYSLVVWHLGYPFK